MTCGRLAARDPEGEHDRRSSVPAAAAIHSVSVSSCLVSGVFSLGADFSIPEMRADRGVGAGPGDDHDAAAVRHRGVHERHVRLVAEDRVLRR